MQSFSKYESRAKKKVTHLQQKCNIDHLENMNPEEQVQHNTTCSRQRHDYHQQEIHCFNPEEQAQHKATWTRNRQNNWQ